MPYIGEIRMFAGNFAPNGWMLCQGQLIAISENDALFSLIGTTYGGDGQETFALPNLAGRAALHMGTGPDGTTYQMGEANGAETITLTVQQIPSHNHPFLANTAAGTQNTPINNVPAQTVSGVQLYREVAPGGTLNATSQGVTGGSQPHENMQPYLCIQYIISLYGTYPSPT